MFWLVWVVGEFIKLANHVFFANVVKRVSPRATEALLEYLTRCYFVAIQFNECEPFMKHHVSNLMKLRCFPAKCLRH